MFVSCVYMLCCVVRGLCGGLITRLEKSCLCLIVCDQETSVQRRAWTVVPWRGTFQFNCCSTIGGGRIFFCLGKFVYWVTFVSALY
jgi:hypothetical protein